MSNQASIVSVVTNRRIADRICKLILAIRVSSVMISKKSLRLTEGVYQLAYDCCVFVIVDIVALTTLVRRTCHLMTAYCNRQCLDTTCLSHCSTSCPAGSARLAYGLFGGMVRFFFWNGYMFWEKCSWQ